MINLKKQQLECKSFFVNNNSTTINNEELIDNDLIMISNILSDSTMNNKESLIRDIVDKSMIIDIMNEQIDDDLNKLLFDNTLTHSMRCKILAQAINNEDSLLKEPTINNILTNPMNNNLKKSLINDTLK